MHLQQHKRYLQKTRRLKTTPWAPETCLLTLCRAPWTASPHTMPAQARLARCGFALHYHLSCSSKAGVSPVNQNALLQSICWLWAAKHASRKEQGLGVDVRSRAVPEHCWEATIFKPLASLPVLSYGSLACMRRAITWSMTQWWQRGKRTLAPTQRWSTSGRCTL